MLTLISPRSKSAEIRSPGENFSHFAGDSAYLLLFLIFLFLTRAAVTSAVMLRQLMRVTESVNLLSLFFVFFLSGNNPRANRARFWLRKRTSGVLRKTKGRRNRRREG